MSEATDIIWRVQNVKGQGPYLGPGRPAMGFDHSLESGHPIPFHDTGIKRFIIEGKEFCGFESREQLEQWFLTKELKKMIKAGYKIVQIKGVITARGEKQVLFIPEKAA